MKKLTLAVVALLIIAGGWYWYSSQGTGGAALGNTQLANPASVNCIDLGGTLEIRDETNGQAGYCHMPDGRVCEEWALFRNEGCNPPQDTSAADAMSGLECHDSVEYFVVARSRAVSSEPGEDILLKKKSSAAQTFACEYAVAAGDTELTEPGPTYFLGIDGHFLLLDSGTAPYPRGLDVYDLTLGKNVYTDRYNRPIEIAQGSLTYWQPVDTKVTAENCPTLAEYQKNYLGAGIERHVSLVLSTLKTNDLGEERCEPRQ